MGQEFKKIGAQFDFRLRAPLTLVNLPNSLAHVE